jgi:hypothetical protein
MEELERRLRLNDSISEEKIQAKLKAAKEDIKLSEIEGSYEKVIVNDDLTRTVTELEQTLFGKTVEDGFPDVLGPETVAGNEIMEEMGGVTAKAEEATVPDIIDTPMTEDIQPSITSEKG